ncbi:c-type cytochrome [Oscillochloris sp. ZM17-4]|uniref:c-type cytochrome n=1 Tax=Oscillochloris sp. ZM17-4 TaxID=2866714 RepID=UPI001C732CB6|nr:c-type cytochrome [Oscillochloris sp. ZM17-4]MBX0329524.1 c-type cytochrome [Oscillochloris sp. ZM17-4]
MSWRPSNSSNYRPSSTPPRGSRDGESAIDPTLRMIIIGAVAVGLIVVGVIVAINLAGSQGAATAAAPPAPAPTLAATATLAAPTAAPVIISSRATATPAPTVGPEDAGPVGSSGDAAAGMVIFNGMPSEALLAGAVTCSTCHLVDPGSGTLVGPSLSGVATRAETRVAGLSAAQYLRTSITAPNSYVVEGFVPGLMTQTFEAALTPEQIEDLVAYLLTLK